MFYPGPLFDSTSKWLRKTCVFEGFWIPQRWGRYTVWIIQKQCSQQKRSSTNNIGLKWRSLNQVAAWFCLRHMAPAANSSFSKAIWRHRAPVSGHRFSPWQAWHVLHHWFSCWFVWTNSSLLVKCWPSLVTPNMSCYRESRDSCGFSSVLR